jgi:hypothetical protein
VTDIFKQEPGTGAEGGGTHVVKEFVGCFAWQYTKMPSLDRGLVEHRLPIKRGF